MDLEKFTERSRGFLQSAQTIAMRESHQRLTAEHLLKALMDDDQGLAANLIRVDCIYASGDYPCGAYATRPLQVRVKFVAELPIDFLPGLTMRWLPQLAPISLYANAVLRYAN